MTIQGTIKEVFATAQISDKFKKREFVVTTEASTPYPQHISIQVTQDKCDMLDQHSPGDEIEVHINIRGREWNGPQGIKYFNTIEAWRIVGLTKGTTAIMHQAAAQPTTGVVVKSDDNNDLPF